MIDVIINNTAVLNGCTKTDINILKHYKNINTIHVFVIDYSPDYYRYYNNYIALISYYSTKRVAISFHKMRTKSRDILTERLFSAITKVQSSNRRIRLEYKTFLQLSVKSAISKHRSSSLGIDYIAWVDDTFDSDRATFKSKTIYSNYIM